MLISSSRKSQTIPQYQICTLVTLHTVPTAYLHGLYYKEHTLGESGGVTQEIAEDGIFL